MSFYFRYILINLPLCGRLQEVIHKKTLFSDISSSICVFKWWASVVQDVYKRATRTSPVGFPQRRQRGSFLCRVFGADDGFRLFVLASGDFCSDLMLARSGPNSAFLMVMTRVVVMVRSGASVGGSHEEYCMSFPIDKQQLLDDMDERIRDHVAVVTEQIAPRTLPQLVWRPRREEWNVLQCFDHLNLSHDYYMPKIAAALMTATPSNASGCYAPSFWGRVYMQFAFNPRLSFPAPAVVTPEEQGVGRRVLADYLERQAQLRALLRRAALVDLRRTSVPIVGGVHFNLGDCVKILVLHDALHIDQALRVLVAGAQASIAVSA